MADRLCCVYMWCECGFKTFVEGLGIQIATIKITYAQYKWSYDNIKCHFLISLIYGMIPFPFFFFF